MPIDALEKKDLSGPGEMMDQCVKHLLSKHEGQSSDPQSPGKALCGRTL